VTDPAPPLDVSSNRFAADAIGASRTRAAETCFADPCQPVRWHGERQDTSAAGWLRLLELIDEAAADGRDVFRPMVDLTAPERADLVTLPATIAKLTRVKHFLLYGSPLIRIPPEIGAMANLEAFEPYTSYSLHWFPYELTRCAKLRDSTVSTRALYGNFKFRPAFPALQPDGALAAEQDREHLDPKVWGVERIGRCSVCDGPIESVHLRQRWISLRVATDVLPLLAHACSIDCVEALPPAPEGYVQAPHQGGADIEQPPRSI
jgi:hypothetical protein